ncbi:hypothetical protein QR680_002033 [Steinernema hermaphroditum]|uniref:Rho-GAP domain-containing protein n=1 Tax=Steinernema hermaphroditum TaxID=289476 RepID=A0AA39H0Y5_9BILA|nr:hypothetical protein QR680_002033 [Steinernema hermaphroditum]
MDRMKEGMQKRVRRFQQLASQNVGLSEKKDELQKVNHVEQKNQKMMAMVKNTRVSLSNCVKTGSHSESIEKRKKKLEDYQLAQQLLSDGQEMVSDAPLLSQITMHYSHTLSLLTDLRLSLDSFVERSAIDTLNKFLEEEKAVNKAREKLNRIALDLESCRKRLQGNHDPTKTSELQEEFDSTQLKFDACRDNAITEIYTLSSKEEEISRILHSIVQKQLEYHSDCVRALSHLQPKVEKAVVDHEKHPVFGCSLRNHLNSSKREIAEVIEACCTALSKHFNERGLFRVNGNNNRIRRLKAAFDAHELTGLDDYTNDPHSICSVLKCYLRELPEPLMTNELHSAWVATARLEPEDRVDDVAKILSRLPEENRKNLAYLIRFLQLMIRYEATTMMNAGNLSIVFGPNLFGCGNGSETDNMCGSRIVETLLMHADYYFSGDHFDFDESPLTQSFNRALNDQTGGFESPDRTSPKSVQLNVDTVSICSTNSLASNRLDNYHSVRSTVSPSSRRPRQKAPPPPGSHSTVSYDLSPNGSTLDQLEMQQGSVSKSSSLASNDCDSMDDYGGFGTTQIEIMDHDNFMTRSLMDDHDRPDRPPPPRTYSQRSSSGHSPSLTVNRPVSYMNAVTNAEMNSLSISCGPEALSNTPDVPPRSSVRLPPPLPAKPTKMDEITKL